MPPVNARARYSALRAAGRVVSVAAIALGSLALSPAALAQVTSPLIVPPSEAPPVVREIVVEGAPQQAEADSARAIFGVTPGDRFDAGDVRLGIRRVFLTGPWADVQVFSEPVPGGVRLVLALVPDLLVGDVVVESGALPAGRLRAAVGLQAGDRFRPEAVEEARLAVTRAASELGYPRAEVSATVEPLLANEHRVRIVVDEGEPTLIDSVVLRGRPWLSEDEVLGMLGVRPGRPFDRLRLEEGLAKLRALLVERRHLRARTDILDVSYGPSRKTVSLRLLIDAGPRYRVDFVGNEIMPHATLKTVMHERELGAIDRASLPRAKDTLESYYRKNGYARAVVRWDDVPAYAPWDKDAERVLRFHIDEGPRVEVRQIIVEGTTARDGRAIAADLWAFLLAETPDGGLVQRMDTGDLEDFLGRGPGKHELDRPVEEPDLILRPITLPFLVPGLERKPVYTAQLFEAARQRIVDRYRKDGFLSATVLGPEPIWLDGGAAVRVRFRVSEGTQVRVSGVRFVPAPTLPLSELLTEVPLEPGQPADMYAIEETRLVVERNLRERGFPFAEVKEQLVRLEPGLVEVQYRIVEGPRVKIGQVRVSGNRMTQDFVIIDRVRQKSGDWYSASAIEESRQRLLRTGLFTSVSVGFLDDKPGAEQRDLLVQVVERPRYSVEAGGGGSLEDGPRAFTSVEVRNILGLGVGLRGRGQVNYPRALYNLYYGENDPASPLRRFDDAPEAYRWLLFTEGQFLATAEIPKLYGVPFDVRVHVDTVGLREIRPAFTLMKGSLLGGVDLNPTPWLHLGPQVELETSDFDCPTLTLGKSCGEGSAGLTRRVDAGTIGQLTLRLLSSLDLRDEPFRPHQGFYSSLSADLAFGAGELRASDRGEGGPVESSFFKVAGVVSGYVPLAPDATLALTVRAGNIFGLPTSGAQVGNYVPLFKRFYLGGTSSIRGFNFDALLPSDDDNWPATEPCPPSPVPGEGAVCPEQPPISLGGNFFVNGRVELRKTLVGDLEFGLFVDGGQLAQDVANVSLAGFAMGGGFGLRYNTPVGPFVLDLGTKIIDGQRRLPAFDDLSRYNVHISIGYF